MQFQLNHHYYSTFKTGMLPSLLLEINNVDWKGVCTTDETIALQEDLDEVEKQVESIKASLKEVEGMNAMVLKT